MRVVCVDVPVPVIGMEVESSPWVTLDREYVVLAISAEAGGRVQLQLVTDDKDTLGWFDAGCFVCVEGDVPSTWVVRLGEKGLLELGPEAWLAPGFWEAYYDGDASAADAVESQLAAILGTGSPG
ncbi:hypothetical protein E0H75_19770 [Kribbella capetownensis]|uniref:Uncharacterized protein n=1 Tax=Kribbella capetownensis TaxID=1572659 RepID=A0A4R0JNK4_9ACTN|nr:hypothetical protein [Kribbella capetownensis]TCC48813.1 hypothetical protein E0H75_19770 [Kribbella capetownensis]